jgi:hypothetical protein
VIDELTARHGIVTSLLVPAYRERAGETVHGSLDVAEDAVARWAHPATDAGAPALDPSAAATSPWLADLLQRIERFARDRGGRAPVVRVTLADGERFFLHSIEAGPGEECLTLHPHPERYDEMVKAGGARLPPRALVVPQGSIVKIELLTKPPRGTRSLVALRRAAP